MMLHSTLVYWINLEKQVTVGGTSLKDCDTNTDLLPFGFPYLVLNIHSLPSNIFQAHSKNAFGKIWTIPAIGLNLDKPNCWIKKCNLLI